jgi:hypothetical protein
VIVQSLIRSSRWDGIEQSRLRGKKETILVSLNPYGIAIDENRREGGTGGEKKGAVSTSSNPHAMAKDWASERSDTQENTNTQIHS